MLLFISFLLVKQTVQHLIVTENIVIFIIVWTLCLVSIGLQYVVVGTFFIAKIREIPMFDLSEKRF